MLRTDTPVTRLSICVGGTVQGVGFRPFVYRLACKMGLCGVVMNSTSGVRIEVEGVPEVLDLFINRLQTERPHASALLELKCSTLGPCGYQGFEIVTSETRGVKTALVTPDVRTCASCLTELSDPADHRFRYPFITCTQCGPRYTVIERVPFDRINTTLRHFAMCAKCLDELVDPLNERFHAQTNTCPTCGPTVELVSPEGFLTTDDVIEKAAAILQAGGIISLKGIGGFQLIANACSTEAVSRLRRVKKRDEKPFAVMFRSLDELAEYCHVAEEERRLLCSDSAPIVLLSPRHEHELASEVSMSSPHVGAMLPYSPLHHILLKTLRTPVVATSCNSSAEPIAYENAPTFARFKNKVDAFLWHNRSITRSCDDSVVKVIAGSETVLRRARGYAPLPFILRRNLPRILAVGGHFKNTIAISIGKQLIVSEHIADLETVSACDTFRRKVESFCNLYGFRPDAVACDLHPLYYSTQYAKSLGLPVVSVQHHHAHLAACMADNDVTEPFLGVAWDGSGFGLDQNIWGGEFFSWDGNALTRLVHLRSFRMPGGDRAVRDGRRVAYSLLREVFGKDLPINLNLSATERRTFDQMLALGFNAPLTTSIGRLFDAVAAIAGVASSSRFEGQAAMLLEGTIGNMKGQDHYPACLRDGQMLELDWHPLVEAIVNDVKKRKPKCEIALKFHNTLSRWIVEVALRTGLKRVLLSGGVFQNGYLTERVSEELSREGLRVYRHSRVPPNDGGLSVGQVLLAAQYLRAQ